MGLDLIYTESQMVISLQQHDWREWQKKFEDYTTNLPFYGVEELSDFLGAQYKLTGDVTQTLNNAIAENSSYQLLLLHLPENNDDELKLEPFIPGA